MKEKKDLEDKHSHTIEEGINTEMCSEPEADYAVGGYADTVASAEHSDVPEDWDQGIGPYSMEELNARIDEAEVFIDEAERGDYSHWVTEEQSRANLYSKYVWLR